MTLTVGHGPLAARPPAAANFKIEAPEHRLLLEDYPYRLRAVVAGEVVLDSRGAKILHETGHQIVPYVPLEDFAGALVRSDKRTHCPFKGEASYWSIQVDGHVVADAVWAYEDPLPEAAWLRGLGSLGWDRADAWYVEEQVAFGPHLRDPYHRVDVVESGQRARVVAGGRVIAETGRPKLLAETSLPLRSYIPRTDVEPGVLVPSAKRTQCPYKGEATYWSLEVDGERIEDAAWSYETPLAEALPVTGDLCFLHDDVEVQLDGSTA